MIPLVLNPFPYVFHGPDHLTDNMILVADDDGIWKHVLGDEAEQGRRIHHYVIGCFSHGIRIGCKIVY